MKPEFARHIFEKYSNTKLHENQSSGSRVVPCGRAGDSSRFLRYADAPERRVRHNLSWIAMRLRTGVISYSLHEQLQTKTILC
jgi:hypothetical protein